jgi:hypothetical protein
MLGVSLAPRGGLGWQHAGPLRPLACGYVGGRRVVPPLLPGALLVPPSWVRADSKWACCRHRTTAGFFGAHVPVAH